MRRIRWAVRIAAALVMAASNPAVYAQEFNRIGLMDAPTSYILVGASPVFSQMNLSSTQSAGYNGWGYRFHAGFQFGLFDPILTQFKIAFGRTSADNNQNTATNREEAVSTAFEAELCVLLFDRACLGGGLQKREVTVTQVNGSSVSTVELSGWSPFARANFELLGSDSSYSLAPFLGYHFGTLDNFKLTELQLGIQISVRIPVK